ncbi:glycosyltransferase family 2 protein [uncultured Winogradskyella sp.]|uniref:glycosyltransferase family 2 protein n=1 Tax=uncultured Winogradskyella sp. TaxID=395353 RepID=UPI00262D836D|nr:glycosyltransferase family 2 protein [uncultured Winogradskyella sp.]
MVTVVIPTYKRLDSLKRTLQSIEKQSLLPEKVLIVIAGISETEIAKVIQNFTLPIEVIISEPSVCKQRNIGIKKAVTRYILLCDDDIVLPENYIKTLITYYYSNPETRIVTGEELRLQPDMNWRPFTDKTSFLRLYYHYIFSLPVWDDLNYRKPTKSFLKKYILDIYKKKGNRITNAGWPLLTNRSSLVFKTSIYSLQAALIPKAFLQKNLFDENLEQYGIGDNYDVGLRINTNKYQTHVLTTIPYKHYKAPSNRLEPSQAYYYRTKTLYQCLKKLSGFSSKNIWYFRWSLFGNGIAFLIKGRFNYLKSNYKVFWNTLTS